MRSIINMFWEDTWSRETKEENEKEKKEGGEPFEMKSTWPKLQRCERRPEKEVPSI